jgi:uncharacterized RDD family membrane protein YckC
MSQRLGAYLIDIFPITALLAAIFYFLLGFDETVHHYFDRGQSDIEARIAFLKERNLIRDLSLLVYLLYAAVLEGSAMQGTVGKWLLGLRVTDQDGRQISVAQSFYRSLTKPISVLPFCLGYYAGSKSEQKQAWHDKIAKTFVISRTDR